MMKIANDTHRCFWDEMEGTVCLGGVWLCETHAICAACLKALTDQAHNCNCDAEGYCGHEELLWCSEGCRELMHPDGYLDEGGQD